MGLRIDLKLKNYDTAIMHLEKSISLKDDDYLIRYYAGSTYFLLHSSIHKFGHKFPQTQAGNGV